ncbi:hypothetical protein JQS43_05095 [Natronosporangium hydrolyticum]|uniref:DUF1795 domain-containing protein n=1 Tax=Natronosporangium hydrolyticum TaxID=2811111 RepID=A0A895YD59_9ACTN|nr:DUF1795 domain-containing protein [Natronosporangium hydrolyticum]QSB15717.1 hypothetical protein JQS43_05095 [Natronosporangium hydrolyticum]
MTAGRGVTQYEHPSAAFMLSLPEQWERIEDIEGVALVAVEPPRGPWFRANVVVTIGQIEPGAPVTDWQDETLELLRQTLQEFVLIDVADGELAGAPARRTLAHHTIEDEEAVNAVVIEQWAVVAGGLGFTLTASVAALEYADYADLFYRVAAGFRPDPEFVP